MTATILVPGLRGAAQDHWLRHWAHSEPESLFLGDEGLAHGPEGRLGALDKAVKAHPGAVLVGHESGALLIARYAFDRPRAPVAGALLVAPSDPARIAADAGETCATGDIHRSTLPFAAIVVASRNATYMDFSWAKALSEDWEADFVDLGLAGDINAESGFGPWPAGQRLGHVIAEAACAIDKNATYAPLENVA